MRTFSHRGNRYNTKTGTFAKRKYNGYGGGGGGGGGGYGNGGSRNINITGMGDYDFSDLIGDAVSFIPGIGPIAGAAVKTIGGLMNNNNNNYDGDDYRPNKRGRGDYEGNMSGNTYGYGQYRKMMPSPGYQQPPSGWTPYGNQYMYDQGAYKINSNSLWLGGNPPKLKNIQKGEGVVVQHREYIADVFSGLNPVTVPPAPPIFNTLFNLQSFDIQPGNSTTFPWLSQLAANFQEYDFTGLVFSFKTLSTDAVVGTNASGALGEVIMATNYNAASPNFLNKQQMLESEYSSSSKPSLEQFHPIECEPQLNVSTHLYVRTGSLPPNQDQRLYDLGNFQIATQGAQQQTSLLGELWCTYEIVLYKPILGGVSSGQDIPTDKFQLIGVTNANLLGTSQVNTSNQIGGTISSNTYTFPRTIVEGTFMSTWFVSGTTASISNAGVSVNGATVRNFWSSTTGNDTSNQATSPTAGASNTYSQTLIFTINNNNTSSPSIVWNLGGGYPGAPAFGDLVITQLNSNISGWLHLKK